jgi:uncharacterized Zn finger protein
VSRGWARRWRDALDDPRPEVELRLARGRSFQRSGRVVDLRVEPGLLAGRVQDSRSTPHAVRIEVPQLDDAAWARVVAAVAGQARHSARLLAGLAPDGLEDELQAEGIALLPVARSTDFSCDCPDTVAPCAHGVALWEAAAERISEEPAALLRLRGRGHQQVLADVARIRRASGDSGPADVVTLDVLAVEGWWSAPAPLEDVTIPHAAPPSVPAPALRLAGDPPGWAGGVSAWDLLGTLVERAGAWAEDLARERYLGDTSS